MATFRVLTFNMQFGQPWNTKLSEPPVEIEGTIEELKKHVTDLIVLQEVEKVEPDKVQVNPPPNFNRIKEALPEYDAYFKYPCEDKHELPFGYGLALLSKTKLYNTLSIDLPAPSLNFTYSGKVTTPTNRLLISARTSFEGNEIQIFNTHLQAFFMIGYSSDDYPQQREIITQHTKQPEGPAVLCGDFNIAPGESTVKHIESAGYRTSQTEVIT